MPANGSITIKEIHLAQVIGSGTLLLVPQTTAE
jgi:hypothetical protein